MGTSGTRRAIQPDGPIQVWLSWRNRHVVCRLVQEDHSTHELDMDSLSMRGAEQEITRRLISQGFKPLGRWETERYDERVGSLEVMRRFVPAKP